MTDPKTSEPGSVALFQYFLSAYKRRTAIMIVLMVLAGIAEGFGVLTLVPVLEFADDSGTPESRVGKAIIALVSGLHLQPTLITLLSMIVVAIFLKAIFLLMAQKQVGYTVAGVTRDLRLEFMRSLLEVRWSFFARRTPGQFANAVSTEARRAAYAYQEACAIIAAVFQMLAYVAVAALLSWQIVVAAFFIAGFLTLLARVFFRTTLESGKKMTWAAKALSARLVDVLQGIKPIKAMGRERYVWPILEHETESLNQASRREVSARLTLRALQEPLLTVFLAIGLYVLLELSGQPVSSMLILAFVFYRLVTHFTTLQGRYQAVLHGQSAFFSFLEDLDEAKDQREERGGSKAFTGLKRGITLENLHFGYNGTDVLSDANAFIAKGSFVAIHGESGSGKTTLADLLVGLHRPREGRILVDGLPLDELDLRSWRSKIGYVPQEMLMFNESVLLNVTLGDQTLSRDDAVRALKLAGAWDFVLEKTDGLDSPMGDRGAMLSGGQRQRIALARALVGRPALLILDEATAALDPATEQAICNTLKDLGDDLTILAISHQAAMRDAADVVFEIQKGRLVEAAPV